MAINFPTTLDDNASLHVTKNNLYTTLTAQLLIGEVTTMEVASTTGWDSSGYLSIDLEIIKYTSTDGTHFLTLTRAQDGTLAAQHEIDVIVELRPVAMHHNDLKDSVVALETKVGVNSSAVATTLDYLLKNVASMNPGHLHNALTFTNTGLHILDTNASHDLIITPGSDLTADKTLIITTGDFDRTMNLIGAVGTIFRSDGTNWAASTPTYPNVATLGKVLIGDGTNIVLSTPTFPNASATAGKLIISNGTDWIASTPSHPTTATVGKIIIGDGTNWVLSTPTYPNTSATTGKILRSDGTNYAVSTFTIVDTMVINTILYASSANVISALATANNGLLVTGATGIPSILAGPGATGRVLLSVTALAPAWTSTTLTLTGNLIVELASIINQDLSSDSITAVFGILSLTGGADTTTKLSVIAADTTHVIDVDATNKKLKVYNALEFQNDATITNSAGTLTIGNSTLQTYFGPNGGATAHHIELENGTVAVRFANIASAVAVGQAVYISAADTVALAKADAIATMPAIGVVVAVPTTTACFVAKLGELGGLTFASANVTVFVSDITAGLLTLTVPSGVNHILQKMGKSRSTTYLDINADQQFLVLN